MLKSKNDIPNFFEEYRAAVNADPTNPAALTNLGWGHYGQNQFKEAAETFEKAIAVDANNLDAHYGLGLTYKNWGKASEAAAEFKKALTLLESATDLPRALLMSRIIKSHLVDLHVTS